MEFLICLLALSFLYLTASSSRVSPHGLEHKQPQDFNIDIAKTVVVGQSGATDFKTIQAAIDSIPSGNNKWIKIQLQNGIYFEKIMIPKEKQKIIMQGNSPKKVIIEYNDAGQANSSGPIVVKGEYFVAINVTFKNSYNDVKSPVPYREIKVAPAIVLAADKASFYGCSFISVQDTLADLVGRHYFKHCYIEGAIDFIWGGGQSLYEKCEIYVKGVTNQMVKSVAILPGYITAQGRESEQDTSGFVFKYCTIHGDGKAALGRAYRSYSRVVFYATSMSKAIVPIGWDAWSYTGQEDKITFAEVKCMGEGADTQRRVEWKKNISNKELAFLINPNKFIDIDGLHRYRMGGILQVSGFDNNAPQFRFVRRRNMALSVNVEVTTEEEILRALNHARLVLRNSDLVLMGSTRPGHYVFYWENKAKNINDIVKLDNKVLVECWCNGGIIKCFYREIRSKDGSIGLEIRVVQQGTFNALMEFSISQGASPSQYKTPMCIKSSEALAILDNNVLARFFSDKSPPF